MMKLLSALAVVLSLAVFGAPVASALETSTAAVSQDGDKGKKKHGKKKKHAKKGKKHAARKKHKKGDPK